MDSFIFHEEYLDEAQACFSNRKEVFDYIHCLCECALENIHPADAGVPKEYMKLITKHLARIRAEQERYLKRKARQNNGQ